MRPKKKKGLCSEQHVALLRHADRRTYSCTTVERMAFHVPTYACQAFTSSGSCAQSFPYCAISPPTSFPVLVDLDPCADRVGVGKCRKTCRRRMRTLQRHCRACGNIDSASWGLEVLTRQKKNQKKKSRWHQSVYLFGSRCFSRPAKYSPLIGGHGDRPNEPAVANSTPRPAVNEWFVLQDPSDSDSVKRIRSNKAANELKESLA